MKDVYLYLLNNTKNMGNTPEECIVPLAQTYELVSEWEVGLMEIMYAKCCIMSLQINLFKLGIQPYSFLRVFMLT